MVQEKWLIEVRREERTLLRQKQTDSRKGKSRTYVLLTGRISLEDEYRRAISFLGTFSPKGFDNVSQRVDHLGREIRQTPDPWGTWVLLY
jgi:hypothetical protein